MTQAGNAVRCWTPGRPTGKWTKHHAIRSFKPGEGTPGLALEIAKEFAQEHLAGYETAIGVHVDRQHIHARIMFDSVSMDTEKNTTTMPRATTDP